MGGTVARQTCRSIRLPRPHHIISWCLDLTSCKTPANPPFVCLLAWWEATVTQFHVVCVAAWTTWAKLQHHAVTLQTSISSGQADTGRLTPSSCVQPVCVSISLASAQSSMCDVNQTLYCTSLTRHKPSERQQQAWPISAGYQRLFGKKAAVSSLQLRAASILPGANREKLKYVALPVNALCPESRVTLRIRKSPCHPRLPLVFR